MINTLNLLLQTLDNNWNGIDITYAEPWTIPWTVPGGERDDFEIHMIEKGTGIFHIGAREFSVKPEDVLLLHSMEGNSFEPESPEFRDVFVTFKMNSRNKCKEYCELLKLLSEEELPLKPANAGELQPLFYQMNRVISIRPEFFKVRLKTLLSTLVLKISDGCETAKTIGRNPADEVKPGVNRHTRETVDQVLMFLHRNYTEQIRLEDISRMVNLNPRYLCTVFRQVTGRTINEQLRDIRLERAKRLLLYTSLGITEIALETGFANSQYFSRVFKQVEGVEPRTFRKNRITE